MHVYFINYHPFRESSGIHIHFLANALEAMGIPCTACVPRSPESVHDFGTTAYRSMGFARLNRRLLLSPGSFRLEGAVFHAWTPREVVRKATAGAARRTGCPYFVHLEDNEEHVFETHTGLTVEQASRLPWFRKALLPRGFIRPDRYREFMACSAGVTCISESLCEAVSGTPAMTFWPACEAEFFDLPPEPDYEFRRAVSIPEEAVVLTYTGNLHRANRDELSTLYRAVAELNRGGRCVRLVRTGSDHADLPADVAEAAKPYVIAFGSRPPAELIRFVAAADILVQPGRPGPFNDYRFPSKLPMYLASGRPVVLPAANIGEHLADGTECRLLRHGTVDELVEVLEPLVDDAGLRRRIGVAGRAFAANRFSWEKSAASVLDFYRRNRGGGHVG
jgi:glycosyltransferase involved in cell wall biosynthesis